MGVMAEVSIVMVARERYSTTLCSLKGVLESTAPDVQITLVRGGLSRRAEREILNTAGTRLKVVGPRRHLAPNTARSIGLAQTKSKYVIFLDNDISCGPGWLDPLVSTAEKYQAWAVRPLILQRRKGIVTIHEAGGDCRIEESGGTNKLIESHLFAGLPVDTADLLETSKVEMFEFHAVLFNRERLVHAGGLDEDMMATADHIDLALRIHANGGSVWLEPLSQMTYEIPESIKLQDMVFFLGRWSPRWTKQTKESFVKRYEIDPYLSSATWEFPNIQRRKAWSFLTQPLRLFSKKSAFVRRTESALRGIFDDYIGQYIANAVLSLFPGWSGSGRRKDY